MVKKLTVLLLKNDTVVDKMRSVYLQLFSSLAIGIYLGDRVSAGDALIFVLALVLVTLLGKLIFKLSISPKVLVILTAALGIFLYHYSVSESVRPAYPLNEKFVTMTGRIVDLPKEKEGYTAYIVQVRNMNYLDKDYKMKEKVYVTSEETFSFGDFVEVRGFLGTFPKKLNSGDFDIARYYKSKGIYFKTHAYSITPTDKTFKNYSPFYYVAAFKNYISEKIYENYSGDKAAMLKAIMTGYKDGFSKEYKEVLYESNTMRYFYPGYMHIFLIISLVGITNTFVKRKYREILLMLLLAFYVVFSSNSHHIIKSGILAIAIVYGKHKIGYSNYIDTLSVVVGAMLLINPLSEYEPGFIMSVSANILLFYFVPPIAQRLTFIKSRNTRRIVAVWLVLSFGMIPLQAYLFYSTTPYAFLLNIIFVPVMSALWLVLPLYAIFEPVLGSWNLFSYTLSGLFFYIEKIPKFVCCLPFHSIHIQRPGVLEILIFYLLLYILRNKLYKKKANHISSRFALAVVLGFSITLTTNFVLNINNLKINFVNVNQGDGAVISLPLRETILIDGGGNNDYSDYDYSREIYLPYLKRNGYTNIDLAIVSHYHSDHAKGIIAAIEKLKVKKIVMPDCTPENENRKEIEALAKKKGIPISYYFAGDTIKFYSGLTIDIISPDKKDLSSFDENDSSYGLRISYGDFSAIFTGDMTKSVEQHHKGEWQDCDILKVAHHGSATSSSEKFLEEVRPEAAIISVGANNSYGHPSDEVLERLSRYNIPVYRTDVYGNISVSASKDGIFKITSFFGDGYW